MTHIHAGRPLKQPQYEPIPFENQVIALFAGARGHLDAVPIDKVADFERSLIRFIDQDHSELKTAIRDEKKISDENEKRLSDAIADFKKGYAG